MYPTVRMKNLSLTLGKEKVLDDVSIDLKSHEITGLIGPSGAGKSTIIECLLGMKKADEGVLTIFEKQMPNREILEKVAFMGHHEGLFEELTAQQNLTFYGQLKGIDKVLLKQQSQRAAQVLGLSKDLHKKVHTFSEEMKKRLSLALVLQTNADLLLIDEPALSVDPAYRQEIWQELRNQARFGKSILLSTAIMDEAEKCDRVILLRKGAVIAHGSPFELKKRFNAQTIEEVFLKAGDLYENKRNL